MYTCVYVGICVCTLYENIVDSSIVHTIILGDNYLKPYVCRWRMLYRTWIR